MVEIARIALRAGQSGTSAGAGMVAIPRRVVMAFTYPASVLAKGAVHQRRIPSVALPHRCAPGKYSCRAAHGYRRFSHRGNAPSSSFPPRVARDRGATCAPWASRGRSLWPPMQLSTFATVTARTRTERRLMRRAEPHSFLA